MRSLLHVSLSCMYLSTVYFAVGNAVLQQGVLPCLLGVCSLLLYDGIILTCRKACNLSTSYSCEATERALVTKSSASSHLPSKHCRNPCTFSHTAECHIILHTDYHHASSQTECPSHFKPHNAQLSCAQLLCTTFHGCLHGHKASYNRICLQKKLQWHQ